jgi:ABC-2 type transport system ATP-binding protein
MIQVKELTKDFGSRRAIDQISFDAKQGEVLGFLGPNGAGKTTTMRILTGYIPPTSGKVTIGGFDILEKSLEVRKLIGYLPETVPLYPDMTVFAYLKFMADLRHLKDADERVEEAIEMVHMEDRALGFIDKLSKGMRQRVGLAQALLHHPDVLILDEPTIGLDPAQIIEVRNLIKEIGKEKTILLSTHILSEAQNMCDRVLIINKGKIVAEDTPQELQNRLMGGRRLALRVRTGAGELAHQLSSVKGVDSVTFHGDTDLDVVLSPSIESRPEIARVSIKKGYDLLEMREARVNLEDIFLELTKDQGEDPRLGVSEIVLDEDVI